MTCYSVIVRMQIENKDLVDECANCSYKADARIEPMADAQQSVNNGQQIESDIRDEIESYQEKGLMETPYREGIKYLRTGKKRSHLN